MSSLAFPAVNAEGLIGRILKAGHARGKVVITMDHS